MPPSRSAIRYLNTDLDLKSQEDLRPLVRIFERNGMYTLHAGLETDKRWHAHFETERDARHPNGHMMAMLNVIEKLKAVPRGIWDRCELRMFNIGYECGFRPSRGNFVNMIPARTLLRMANVGLAMRITLYPPVEEQPPSLPSGRSQRRKRR